MATIEELRVLITADNSDLKRTLLDSETATGRLANRSQAAFRTMGRAAVAGTAAVAGGVGLATKTFIDFESAFAGVRKTVDASEAEFAELEAGIRGMAKEIPASAAAIASVAEAAGQLGIETPNILEFSRVMVDLGNATNLSAEQAATSLARLANITGLPQDQFDRLGSTIVALGNNLATTEAEIVDMSMRLAGAGTQIGLTQDQILAFAGGLSSVGIAAEAGGTAMSRVFVSLAQSVDEGGEKLDEFSRVAGMSAEQFATAFRTDAAGAIQSFIGGLGELDAQGESVFQVLEGLELADIRVRDALLRASGASEVFSSALDIGSDSWEQNNALANEAAQRYETTASKLAILKNQLTDMGITVGAAVAPALLGIVDSLRPLVEEAMPLLVSGGKAIATVLTTIFEVLREVGGAFKSAFEGAAGDSTEAAANALGLFHDAVAVLTPVMSALATAFGATLGFLVANPNLVGLIASIAAGIFVFVKAAAAIRTAIMLWQVAQIALNIALTANPIGIIIVAIGALVGAIIFIVEKTIGWKNVFAAVADFFVATWSALKTFWDATIGALVDKLGGFKNVLLLLMGPVALVAGFIIRNWDEVKATTTAIWDGIKRFFSLWWDTVTAIFTTALDLVKAIFRGDWDEVKAIVARALLGIIRGIRDTFGDLPAKMLQFGQDMMMGLLRGILSMKDKVVDTAKSVGSGIKDGFKDVLGISSPSKVFSDFGQNIVQGLENGLGDMDPVVQATVDPVRRAINMPPPPIPATGGFGGQARGGDRTIQFLGDIIMPIQNAQGGFDARGAAQDFRRALARDLRGVEF